MKDFSLVLLVRRNCHLLPLTLEALKTQKDANFEVILLDAQGKTQVTGQLASIARQYPELLILVKDASGKSLAEMMNLGLIAAQGKYIQFLEPGEYYILITDSLT